VEDKAGPGNYERNVSGYLRRIMPWVSEEVNNLFRDKNK
jgi:hypothetical protein